MLDFDDDDVMRDEKSFDRTIYQLSGKTENMSVFMPNKSSNGVVNPYRVLGAPADAWPRGLPLEKIQASFANSVMSEYEIDSNSVGVVQSLANGDPDVDAIYRLTNKMISFDFARAPQHPVVAIPRGMLTPWNAQATIFNRFAHSGGPYCMSASASPWAWGYCGAAEEEEYEDGEGEGRRRG